MLVACSCFGFRPPIPPKRGHIYFWSMSTVAKRSPISDTAEHLLHSSRQSVHILYDRPPLYSLKLPLRMGDVDCRLIYAPSGPRESHSKQHQFSPYCSSRQMVPILHNGSPLPPPKLPLPIGELDPHLIHGRWSHQSDQSSYLKRHFDRFSRFCRADNCDRLTYRLTDYAIPSVTICLICVVQ